MGDKSCDGNRESFCAYDFVKTTADYTHFPRVMLLPEWNAAGKETNMDLTFLVLGMLVKL